MLQLHTGKVLASTNILLTKIHNNTVCCHLPMKVFKGTSGALTSLYTWIPLSPLLFFSSFLLFLFFFSFKMTCQILCQHIEREKEDFDLVTEFLPIKYHSRDQRFSIWYCLTIGGQFLFQTTKERGGKKEKAEWSLKTMFSYSHCLGAHKRTGEELTFK